MENNINVLPKGTILHNGKRKYKVEKVLGTGGFGITYKVSSTVSLQPVTEFAPIFWPLTDFAPTRKSHSGRILGLNRLFQLTESCRLN